MCRRFVPTTRRGAITTKISPVPRLNGERRNLPTLTKEVTTEQLESAARPLITAYWYDSLWIPVNRRKRPCPNPDVASPSLSSGSALGYVRECGSIGIQARDLRIA